MTDAKKYADWIAANVPAECRGLCVDLTKRMAEQFPELRRVRGHYTPFAGRATAHWWLETAFGEVVDPTAAQFDDGGTSGDYREYAGPEPIGQCLDCGALIFAPAYELSGVAFCNEQCAQSTFEYVKSGGRIGINGVLL